MRSFLVRLFQRLYLTSTDTYSVVRNPLYITLGIIALGLSYIIHTLNLWGPIIQMTNAASAQALEEGKKRLREFLEASETGRQAVAMSGQEDIVMQKLNGHGKAAPTPALEEDEDI